MRYLATLGLLAVLAGCAGSNFSYDNARKVKVGMTEAQVTQLMGRPTSIASRGNEQMWMWSHGNGFTGNGKAVSFKMSEGKVIEVPTIPSSFK